MLPANGKDDGKERDQFEKILFQISSHDTQLKEVQEKEWDRVINVSAVDVHFFNLSVTAWFQRTIPDAGHTKHQHT